MKDKELRHQRELREQRDQRPMGIDVQLAEKSWSRVLKPTTHNYLIQ
jgi:hypothetical protein